MVVGTKMTEAVLDLEHPDSVLAAAPLLGPGRGATDVSGGADGDAQ